MYISAPSPIPQSQLTNRQTDRYRECPDQIRSLSNIQPRLFKRQKKRGEDSGTSLTLDPRLDPDVLQFEAVYFTHVVVTG
jgi:hypothetical protein